MTDERNRKPASGAFPLDFVWGAATSAYQVEGSCDADGRGRSIWDVFAAEPGRILDGGTGEPGADSYRRLDEDVALMERLGLTAYRFSVSWPRVQPDGAGKIKSRGLDYYRRLVDTLLAAGIAPWITLYHWDLPQALEDAGGWPRRETAQRFGDFADVVGEALGDRANRWITVNEPWCAAFLGYASGEHAPGRREPVASLAAAHHLMLGHGLATEAIHARSASSHVGVGLNFYPTYPASAAAADLDAARRIDGMQNRLFADAIFKGGYPSDVLEDLSAISDLKFIRDADAAVISAPTDMLCVNYYSRYTVTGRRGGQASASAAPVDAGSPWPANEHVGFVDSGLETTGMSWEIDPDGLRAQLVRLSRDYPGVPLVVTENGSAFDDEVEADAVHDVERRDYLASHLDACAAALAEGAPLRGYFTWSLMDNFEWAWGYTKRFGIVHVDFDTQRRIVKDSGRWYAEEITRNTRGLSGRL